MKSGSGSGGRCQGGREADGTKRAKRQELSGHRLLWRTQAARALIFLYSFFLNFLFYFQVGLAPVCCFGYGLFVEVFGIRERRFRAPAAICGLLPGSLRRAAEWFMERRASRNSERGERHDHKTNRCYPNMLIFKRC